MGETYRRGFELDRRDNNGGYTPDNCRWVPRVTNGNNRRTNTMLDTPAGRMTASEAARFYQIRKSTLFYRLNQGWPLLKALGYTTF
jgi:hypothetical protein